MPAKSTQELTELTRKRPYAIFAIDEVPTSREMTTTQGYSQAAPPATLSIYQLARLNCREQLIIEPLWWTSRHVELLQCSFKEPSVAPMQSNFNAERSGGAYVRTLFDHHKYGWREFRIRQILSGPKCPFTALENLHFYFDQRHISILPCVTFFLQGNRDDMANGCVPAIAAFIDCAQIDELRFERLYHCQGRRHSKPTSALFKLKLKKVTPPEPLHDPYIVALLIAIAHQQRSALRSKCQDTCATFLSRVLLTDINDTASIHLFTADISSSFLRKLDFPAIPPSALAPPFVSIRHTTIPYKPSKTFRNRIFPLLLPSLNPESRE
ncbi:hypothetical protein EMCG_09737 [[Emmonsia] crescens]|uniref:Uncharacterized protein n=1 Tax=[Emmonsia] crescens TaxID=73230 RepID=A0A0G2I279_9EURO|nr:hypothetical protein EMCG_09737 [Emmonsia crescens UAMH 3008]